MPQRHSRIRRDRLLRVIALVMGSILVASCAGSTSDRKSAPSPVTAADVVQTSSGSVRGVVDNDYRVFKGIPYAAAPAGEMRWQPPAPAPAWAGTRDATKPGLRCIQDVRLDPDYGLPTSEDCLNLNVWTPSGASPASPRAVMVWIHGGGFLNGSADIYDARWLTTQGDIVVVTVNYRLGTLGFLAHPGLASNGQIGNYGLLDQQAALRWVRDNIADFGGDPSRVTIAGESAGAMSVCDHLVAPASAGLFRAAIMQSGPCQVQADKVVAEEVSKEYAASVGCTDEHSAARCLRDLPVARLEERLAYVGFGDDRLPGPITGTEAVPQNPIAAAITGQTARVPILIGTNSDEFSMFVAVQYLQNDNTLPSYQQMLDKTYGSTAAVVAVQYPLADYGGNAGLAYATTVTDSVFACPVNDLTRGLAENGPVYAYEFTDRTAPAPDPLRKAPFPIGASHSLELRYLFDVGGAPALDPAQRTLSAQMIQYWAQFVKTGAPLVTGQPVWPKFGVRPENVEAPESGGSGAQRLELQTGTLPVSIDFAARHQCDFWASMKPVR